VDSKYQLQNKTDAPKVYEQRLLGSKVCGKNMLDIDRNMYQRSHAQCIYKFFFSFF
jgi:hypothetical protein